MNYGRVVALSDYYYHYHYYYYYYLLLLLERLCAESNDRTKLFSWLHLFCTLSKRESFPFAVPLVPSRALSHARGHLRRSGV